MTLPCFKCGRVLESAVPPAVLGDDGNQPSKGTAFSTVGHYGSTFIDNFSPLDPRLEINICDPCLRAAPKGTLRWVRDEEA